MNILIYFGNQLNPNNGGTERVACLIADYLIDKGHKVLYMSSTKANGELIRSCSFLPDPIDRPSTANILFVRQFIEKNSIDVVINEGASTDSVFLFSHKHLSKNVKIISHLHFNVRGDIDSIYKSQYLPLCGVPLKEVLKNTLKWIKLPYNRWRALRNKVSRYRYMYQYSDKIIVLSEKQVKLLCELINIPSTDKIEAVINPLSFESPDCVRTSKHDKTVIFVGRLEYCTKRVDRIINVWNKVSRHLPEWNLKIVGAGEDMNRLMRLSKKLNLSNIEFVGQADARKYYKTASILLLTSNHEGTPMVIPEAMSFGVVPVVMNNFTDADMYVKNGETGLLTRRFDIDDMASAITGLVNDPDRLNKMSESSINAIKAINNDELLSHWNRIVNE